MSRPIRDPADARHPSPPGDLVVQGAGLLLTARSSDGDPLGLIRDGALVCRDGAVAWVGTTADLPRCGIDLDGMARLDAGGRLVTPGLIDCHVHPIFAGNRADEFGRRAAGQGYLEIAAAGGGINATLAPTRAASVDEHIAITCARLDRMLATGTTTCEAKSGYDLTVDGEIRMLEIARAAGAVHPIDVVPTLLGAHLVPPERADDRDGYVDDVIERMIPAAAAGLAEAIDVYCDQGAYTLDETRRILTAGAAAGLAVRAHVGQFSDLGGAELVAELGGRSVDHLEQVSPAGIAALAHAGVVAVMLPGACVQLRMAPPPVAALRRAGVPLAVASDLNPGSTYCESLPLQMWLATTHLGMTVEETWLGVTRIAARVLGRPDRGTLEVGAAADLALWDAEVPAEIPYRYGANLIHRIIKSGTPIP